MAHARLRLVRIYATTTRVLASYLWLRARRPLLTPERYSALLASKHQANARRIRDAIVRAGGLFIKVGQLISILANFLPEQFVTRRPRAAIPWISRQLAKKNFSMGRLKNTEACSLGFNIGRALSQRSMLAKRITTVASLAFACGALFFAAFLASSALAKQDFTAFWSAAHLVSRNPYSLSLVTAFERSRSIFSPIPAIVMKNPPWTLLFLLPLSAFNYGVAFALWTVFEVVAILGCARAIWNLYISTSPPPIFLPLCFGPTVVLLMLGQLDALVLIGITLFLVMAERKHDWAAGASLVLIMTKPHVVVFFLLALALWIAHSRRWTILWAGLLATASSSVAILAINPRIFADRDHRRMSGGGLLPPSRFSRSIPAFLWSSLSVQGSTAPKRSATPILGASWIAFRERTSSDSYPCLSVSYGCSHSGESIVSRGTGKQTG